MGLEQEEEYNTDQQAAIDIQNVEHDTEAILDDLVDQDADDQVAQSDVGGGFETVSLRSVGFSEPLRDKMEEDFGEAAGYLVSWEPGDLQLFNMLFIF